jgi:MFS family permease
MSASQMDGDRLARHNALVLAAATALAGANASVVISTGAIVGKMLSGETSLATIPVLFFVLGTAGFAFPASYAMRRMGRRAGFMGGALFGVFAGLVGALAVVQGSFAMFSFGTFLCGAYQAFVLQYRYAAADTATPAFRPKAISWTLAGGLAAAFVGPQLVVWTKDSWAPYAFSATYVAQAMFALIAIFVLIALRAPPVKVVPTSSGRPLAEIFRDPRLVSAVLLGMIAQAVMNLVMTATPLAMVGCALPISTAALAIQWHIVGMYGPSFFTGNLIGRFGREKVAMAGFVILAVSGVVAEAGLTVWHFWISLILLGIGWNFAFVSATAMVTDCHTPDERAKVQASNDFLIFGGTALAAWSSGWILDAYGWSGVAFTLFPAALVGFVLVVIAMRRARRVMPA